MLTKITRENWTASLSVARELQRDGRVLETIGAADEADMKAGHMSCGCDSYDKVIHQRGSVPSYSYVS